MRDLWPVILFPAFGAMLLLLAAGKALHRLVRMSREKTAEGTVTGTWFWKGDRMIVGFVPEGHATGAPITFKSHEPGSAEDLGKKVVVFYDPRNPEGATLVTAATTYRIAAAMAGIGLLLVAVGYVVARFLSFGAPAAEVEVDPSPRTTPVKLKGRDWVKLELYVRDSVRTWCKSPDMQAERLTVEVVLLRRDRALETVRLVASGKPLFSKRNVAEIDLPPEGIDAVRTSYRLEPEGCEGELDGLVVQLRPSLF